jgi:hypothetical protein
VQALAEAIEHLARPGEERVPRRRHIVAVAVGDVGPDDVAVGREHALQLGIEVR